MLTAATSEDERMAKRAYASGTDLSDFIIYDPFAGSGTVLVEAAKLGATVIGRDINPVATLTQRQALHAWDETALQEAFAQVASACSSTINSLYATATGERVLYYFWVMLAQCPVCEDEVELFSRYIFARHAYPKHHPKAQATCPTCHAVVPVNLESDTAFTCSDCQNESPLKGPVQGELMICSKGHKSRVIEGLRGTMPRQRMYAKLVATGDGARQYRPIDDFDRALYHKAEGFLDSHRRGLALPTGSLTRGYNTSQALRWGFTEWASFFNPRQLYCLGLLGRTIRDLGTGPAEREALTALFSKVLEFNNAFTSYKGEGTGAVRSIFHNHTLKPERTSLEANPWGAAHTSGGFLAHFDRLILAASYKRTPRDLVLRAGEIQQIDNVSVPFGAAISSSWSELQHTKGATYISCGDSSATDIPDGVVDLIITDPPYVDNLHYSELADFFHAWLRNLHPYIEYPTAALTTRDAAEVQNVAPLAFQGAIAGVWKESARVLRDDGVLAFSFHQARADGWTALMAALRDAGLVVTALQPVKAEMATSVAKTGAATPNNLDSIVVCRKVGIGLPWASSVTEAIERAKKALLRLRRSRVFVHSGDIASVYRGSVLSLMTNPNLELPEDDLVAEADRHTAQLIRRQRLKQTAR
jgi:adenine-specific DNA methylase